MLQLHQQPGCWPAHQSDPLQLGGWPLQRGHSWQLKTGHIHQRQDTEPELLQLSTGDCGTQTKIQLGENSFQSLSCTVLELNGPRNVQIHSAVRRCRVQMNMHHSRHINRLTAVHMEYNARRHEVNFCHLKPSHHPMKNTGTRFTKLLRLIIWRMCYYKLPWKSRYAFQLRRIHRRVSTGEMLRFRFGKIFFEPTFGILHMSSFIQVNAFVLSGSASTC
nr:uncharacterized protein LOC125986103 [Syngnathus scovelli]